ncbi:MAG: metallophosphoesterase [Calditrichaeota bacterium]|nr:metallophosphoesterase [Calditrichota bacterium]
MRRFILSAVVILFASISVAQSEELTFIVEPYLQLATKNSITILWETNIPANSFVEYGPAKLRQQEASLPLSASNEKLSQMHEVVLNDLTEQTDYFYRVVSVDADGRKIESDVFSFQTAVKEESAFAFAIFSDTQHNKGIRHVWGDNAKLAWAERPNFALNAGDVVEDGNNQELYREEYLKPAAELMRRIPVYSVLGNHDDNSKYYYQYMANPQPEYYYTFIYGNAQFFMLDSNHDLNPGSEQYDWLEKELAASKAVWKFAVHHHPVYSSDENDYGDTNFEASLRGDPSVSSLKTLYERYNVDIVFAGHIHQYERTWPLRDEMIQDDGVRYVVVGGSGGGLEQFALTRSWFTAKVRSAHHFVLINIHKNKLQFQAIDEHGNLFDQITIDKPEQILSSADRAPSAPLIYPAAGRFVDKTEITLKSLWENTTIRYTIDGSEPTSESELYDDPVIVSENTILKARNFNSKGLGSTITSATYTKTEPLAAAKIENVAEGLNYSYYEGQWKNLPDFSQLQPLKTGTASTLDLQAVKPQEDFFAVVYEGYLDIQKDGVYKFLLTSDDGSRLYIADKLVVDNDGSHSAITGHGEIALAKGKHPFKLQYFEDYAGEVLELKYSGPGIERQTIKAEAFSH